MRHWFEGRTLVIATKHQKESVLAPLFENELGVKCFVPDQLDTDSLGTFTGEVERESDPLESARRKCQLALDHTGADLVLASEGSFGPHPQMVFAHADDELLLFRDTRNHIEVFTRCLSTETNFNAREIFTRAELMEFATAAGFPEHALIIKPAKNQFEGMVKGIHSWTALLEIFENMKARQASVYVETDMRAMYNPMRMACIEKTARRLLDKIKSCCPICEFPGFGMTALREGLPCELCQTPTRSPKSYIYECVHCEHVKEDVYPQGKKFESPMYCDNCNP